jgi:hypothetical protein
VIYGVDPQTYFTNVLTKLVNLWPASRIDDALDLGGGRALDQQTRGVTPAWPKIKLSDPWDLKTAYDALRNLANDWTMASERQSLANALEEGSADVSASWNSPQKRAQERARQSQYRPQADQAAVTGCQHRGSTQRHLRDSSREGHQMLSRKMSGAPW